MSAKTAQGAFCLGWLAGGLGHPVQRTRTPFRRADLVNVRFTPESGHVRRN
jgi:hypothetical protein